MPAWPPTPADVASSEHPGREEDITLDFSGGLNLRDPPHLVQSGQLTSLINMHYPRECAIPVTRPGAQVLVADTGTGTEVTATHVYRYSETVSYNCYTVINATKQELWYQTGVDAPVLIEDDLGSLLTPCMVTMGGALLVAIAGQYIYEWQGGTGGSPARGVATFTFTDNPNAAETITIGAELWTWKASGAVPPFEVNITSGGTAAADAEACCAALVASINASSSVVKAVVAADPKQATVSARRIGTAGNLVTSEATTNGSWSGNLAGGVAGLLLDQISSYLAPKPAFFLIDQNQRLVGAADPAAPDTIYFSAPSPAGPWQWATGTMGGGETFLVGSGDGMDVTAIQSAMGEMIVHKSGQGREIWRINTTDPDPSTWSLSMKKFHANVAALNSRCAVAVTDKLCFLDTRGFSTLTGTDTFDQIAVKMAGEMLGDRLASPVRAEAFIVVNPDESYLMVFPQAGQECWVFHYGTGRWAQWNFALAGNITCGCYSDALETVVLGTDDAQLLKLDPLYATDGAAPQAFPSELITPILGGGRIAEVLVTQTILSWRNVIEGAGSVSLKPYVGSLQPLFDFATTDAALLLSGSYATTTDLEDATLTLLEGEKYSEYEDYTQGGGKRVSLVVRLQSGAFAPSGALQRVAYHGR